MRGRAVTPRVFISSTTGALDKYRRAAVDVCRRLGLIPVAMEEFPAERPPPLDVCRRKVEESDVAVVLLAHRYGDRPPAETKSYTELEYEWALARPDMPLLPFVVEEDHPWPPSEIDRDPMDVEALRCFRDRLHTHHIRTFGDIHAFREDLFVALRDAVSDGEGDGEAADEEADPVERRLPSPPAFVATPPYAGGAPFTGRAEDLAELDAWVRSDDPMMVLEAVGGTGKSALTWTWADSRAPDVLPDLAGRFWWSFYEGSASMRRFLTEVLAYVTQRPLSEVEGLPRAELAAEVLHELRQRPFLLVLDGFERLLAAYHRFDPTKLREDEVEQGKRALIEPNADRVLRDLAAAGPSKVLISSRLLPETLERYGRLLPGVRHTRLPGLTDADTAILLERLGVHGDREALARFFGRLGNHPLLIGIVAGLVRDYRPRPGDFDRWLEDPLAGGRLSLPKLDLTDRRHHILEAALSGLPADHGRVLGSLSVFTSAVHWSTLESINPLRPDPPAGAVPPAAGVSALPPEFGGALEQLAQQWQLARAEWAVSPAVKRADARLIAALSDLEDRGLLWWDREANTYDLHPIVRVYAFEQLQEGERVSTNERIRAHFEALPPEDLETASSVEYLERTITIFRALVGSGRSDEASALWQGRLWKPLYLRIAAYASVIELLTPLREVGSSGVRQTLGGALSYCDRFDEAMLIEADLLADALSHRYPEEVATSLGRQIPDFVSTGQLVAANRCVELLAHLNDAAPQDRGELALGRATLQVLAGEVGPARRSLNEAERLGTTSGNIWFEGDVKTDLLRLDFIEGKLDDRRLEALEREFTYWGHRRPLVALRRDLLIQKGEFDSALEVQHEDDQLARNAGAPVDTAYTAFLLARLGRVEDAEAVLEDTLAALGDRHPASREHYVLARALVAMRRRDEAQSHAVAAYRQAWADGPPYSFHWDLKDAGLLLDELGLDEPNLPTVDPGAVKIPHEDAVRSFIAELRDSPER